MNEHVLALCMSHLQSWFLLALHIGQEVVSFPLQLLGHLAASLLRRKTSFTTRIHKIEHIQIPLVDLIGLSRMYWSVGPGWEKVLKDQVWQHSGSIRLKQGWWRAPTIVDQKVFSQEFKDQGFLGPQYQIGICLKWARSPPSATLRAPKLVCLIREAFTPQKSNNHIVAQNLNIPRECLQCAECISALKCVCCRFNL